MPRLNLPVHLPKPSFPLPTIIIIRDRLLQNPVLLARLVTKNQITTTGHILSLPIPELSHLSLNVALECSLHPHTCLNKPTTHSRPIRPDVQHPVAPDYLPQSPAFTQTMIILNRRQVPPNGGLVLVPKISAPSEEQHMLHHLLPVVVTRALMKDVLRCATDLMISIDTWSRRRTRLRHTNVWRVRGCLLARIL
jgi:hypothetical protein